MTGAEKGLAEGMRKSIKVDNHCALEVGHLREGSRSFEVRRPKCEEGSPEVSRGIDAQSAGSGGTKKSCINVDHVSQERWSPSWVDADWHAFCQVIYKGIEGEDCEELYDCYEETSG